MERLIKAISKEYAVHAQDLILTSFLTIMMWIGLQNLINEGAVKYLPGLKTWQISIVEVALASLGLWWVSQKKAKQTQKEQAELLDGQSPEKKKTNGTPQETPTQPISPTG